MLSISARGSATSAGQYYQHLTTGREGQMEDYYAKDGAGIWAGKGAEVLGLAGEVTEKDFMSLAQGFAPNGEAATQNAGQDSHRAGWDLTFSAPKSVSIAWALGDDKTRSDIEVAHREAVKAALDYAERHAAYSRMGHGGAEKVAASLVASVYQHGTSREGDPQLHSHAFVHNVTVRPNGSTGTLEPYGLYTWKMAIGAAYRAELSSRLERVGLRTERDREFFRLTDVPKDLEGQFSTRREQIRDAMAEKGVSGAKAAEKATLDTRRAKEDLSRNDLLPVWREAAGLEPEQDLSLVRSSEPSISAVDKEPRREPTTREIGEKLTDKQATFTDANAHALIMVEAQCSGGGLKGGEIKVRDFLDKQIRLEGRSMYAKFGERYTTEEMRQLENHLHSEATLVANRRGHEVGQVSIDGSLSEYPTLSSEQRKMVETLVKDSGDLALVQGSAGAGKSYALGASREAWEREGYTVVGAAVSGQAAQSLEEGSGIESRTVASMLSAESFQVGEREVVIIDEAGMIGTKDLDQIISGVREGGGKVVLVGDTQQLQSIDAGAPFRALQEKLGTDAYLSDNRRQANVVDREAVAYLRAGDAEKGIDLLARRENVKIAGSAREAKEIMGQSIAKDLSEGKSSLGIAATRQDASDINKAARAAAREQGLVIGKDISTVTRHGPREFAVGDRIVLTRNVNGGDLAREMGGPVKNGWRGTVATLNQISGPRGEQIGTGLQVRLDNGESRWIDTRRYDHIDTGYAVTCHKSQGATVDRAHVLATETAMPTGKEWAYVAATRHRESVQLHTDPASLNVLAPEWSKSRAKDMALDYDRKASNSMSYRQVTPDISRSGLTKDAENNSTTTRVVPGAKRALSSTTENVGSASKPDRSDGSARSKSDSDMRREASRDESKSTEHSRGPSLEL